MTWIVRGDIYILTGAKGFCWIHLFGIGARASRELKRKHALVEPAEISKPGVPLQTVLRNLSWFMRISRMSGDSWENVQVSGVTLEMPAAKGVDSDILITITGRTRMKRRDANSCRWVGALGLCILSTLAWGLMAALKACYFMFVIWFGVQTRSTWNPFFWGSEIDLWQVVTWDVRKGSLSMIWRPVRRDFLWVTNIRTSPAFLKSSIVQKGRCKFWQSSCSPFYLLLQVTGALMQAACAIIVIFALVSRYWHYLGHFTLAPTGSLEPPKIYLPNETNKGVFLSSRMRPKGIALGSANKWYGKSYDSSSFFFFPDTQTPSTRIWNFFHFCCSEDTSQVRLTLRPHSILTTLDKYRIPAITLQSHHSFRIRHKL